MVRLRSILWSVCVSLLVMISSQQAAMADDTEIFFGGSSGNTAGQPNILFIMDTSSSMVNNKDGTSSTRIDRMKKALTEIVKTSNNVNVGMMRFNNPGGAVLYPVTDIDLPVADEDQGKENVRIADGADDAQELDTGEMILNGNVLSLVSTPTPINVKNVGLRFQDVDIPQGATITSAKIEFTTAATSPGTTSLTFHAEDIDNSPGFLASSNNISSRSLTSDLKIWSPLPLWMVVGDVHETPDLSDIVQEVVDRAGWCGGNALSIIVSGTSPAQSHLAKAYEDNASDAPKLLIEFDEDSIPAGGGCVAKEHSAQISSDTDDVEENTANNGSMYITSSDLEIERDGSRRQVIGLRFGGLNLPAGAAITNAYLEFTADGDSSGDAMVTIAGVATDDADTFDLDPYDVTSRTSTSASAQWNVSEWVGGQTYRSSDISNVVSEIVGRAGWSISSHMAFKITSTPGTHRAYSFKGSPGESVRLVIQSKSLAGTETRTARDELLDVVDDMLTGEGTPIVDAFYEGALYYKGENVLYGKYRGKNSLSDSVRKNNRVSDSRSYAGGSHTFPTECSASNLGSVNCVGEVITGDAAYISPVVNSCQSNNIVLLSDGQASVNDSASAVRAMTGITGSCVDGGNQACGPELAKFLVDEEQSIKTYTIGFNIAGQAAATDFLQRIAKKGGGSFYEAASSADLVGAFENIVNNVMRSDTTFVSPGIAVNSFNRLNHRDEMYFSLFKPESTPLWSGNLKRYRIADAVIYDKNNAEAINNATGAFKPTSRSWWSSGVDGAGIEKGGVADRVLATVTSRNVYTYLGDMTPASGVALSGYPINESNDDISKELLGIELASDDYREDLVKWVRGVDAVGVADPLHSAPSVVIYGGTDALPISTIFYGDNQGYLHAVDGETGNERFAFMPKELLPVQNVLYENNEAHKHPYGLDGQVTTWVNDVDGDGVIESGDGDHVYAYIGMRRGGNNYYALDVTNPSAPKWLWGIAGGTGDFSELGQTWSQPKKSKVNIEGTVTDVLIFAGGYDAKQDDATTRAEDAVGRAIYMVNAKTGKKLWAGGPSGLAGGFVKTFPEMKYSIPSSVLVLDMNDDGLADKMFVGDVGGQLWRFDIANGSNASQLVTGGVVFEASGTSADSDESQNRRFYDEPDISTFRRDRKRYFSIKMGSGFRAHPLNEVVEDRFYVIHDSNVSHAPTDGNGDVSYEKLTESHLYDATSNIIGESDGAQQLDAETQLNAADGWYIRLTRSGEKVLASSLTLQHEVYFTTYEPEPSSAACTVAAGTSRLYHVNATDATPVINYDGAGGDAITDLTKSDREVELKTTAIAPTPVRLRVGGQDVVVVGTEIIKPSENNVVYTRTYWFEE